MIDAATFANSYTAIWRSIAPTCEVFVRRLNLDGCERFEAPIPSEGERDRRALTAETGFSYLIAKQEAMADPSGPPVVTELWKRALHLAKNALAAYERQGLDLETDLSASELSEAQEIADRLEKYFFGERLVVKPKFHGCGYIDESEADILAADTLYEIKTVDRPFRSSDVRQLITYCALNYASGQYQIREVSLVNPRRGLACKIGLDDVCTEISGNQSIEVLSEIVSSISDGEISR